MQKKALTLHLTRGEGRERYFGCNLMQHKVLASSYQHLMAEAPGVELVPVEEDELDVEAVEEPAIRVRVGEAFATLVTSLPPKERASVVLKDVLDYPLS